MTETAKKDTKQPTGYFDRILALDSETSGIFFEANPARLGDERYQAVSWGMQILNGDFEVLDELYIEIQWDGKSKWSDRAQKVHGLTKEHLAANADTFEDAYVKIVNFIFKWFGTTPVVVLGHNVAFDLAFLRSDLQELDLKLSFGNRVLDSNTLGFTVFETYTSDQLFEILGQEDRESHNALDDIKRTVQAFRVARSLARQVLG